MLNKMMLDNVKTVVLDANKENDIRHGYEKGSLWVRYDDERAVAKLHDIYKIYLRYELDGVRSKYVRAEHFAPESVMALQVVTRMVVRDPVFFGCEGDEYTIAFLNGVRATWLKRCRAEVAEGRRRSFATEKRAA